MGDLGDGISRILGGISPASIIEAVAAGDFGHVMKLKEYFIKSSPEIDTLLAATCLKEKRNLIHWLVHHKKLEILRWIRGKKPRSMSSSSSNEGRHWPTIALERKVSHSYFTFNAKDKYGCTALHLATLGDHEEVVQALLAYDTWVDIDVVAENIEKVFGPGPNRNGLTPLHVAVIRGNFRIVKILLDFLRDRMQDRDMEGRTEFREVLSIKGTTGMTALHYAAEHGSWEVMRCLIEALKLCEGVEMINNCDVFRRTPLYHAVSKQKVEVVEILLREGGGLSVTIVTWEGITPLGIAKRNEAERRKKLSKKLFAKRTEAECETFKSLKEEEERNHRIIDMLESYDVNWLQAERAKYANASNCLLVGAALIATVTYAGWMQPPLGLTQYYEFPISSVGAPPESFDSYVGVQQHPIIQLFWIFNSISFFCSLATFIIGADAGIPQKCASLREEVVDLRKSTVRASFVLAFAIVGVMGAFSVAGILVLPPIERQRAPTYVTMALGVIFCLILLAKFMMKIWIWFRSPSLQFRMGKNQRSEGVRDEVSFNSEALVGGPSNVGAPSTQASNLCTPSVKPPERVFPGEGASTLGTQVGGQPMHEFSSVETLKPKTSSDETLKPKTPVDGSTILETLTVGPSMMDISTYELDMPKIDSDGPSIVKMLVDLPSMVEFQNDGPCMSVSPSNRLGLVEIPSENLSMPKTPITRLSMFTTYNDRLSMPMWSAIVPSKLQTSNNGSPKRRILKVGTSVSRGMAIKNNTHPQRKRKTQSRYGPSIEDRKSFLPKRHLSFGPLPEQVPTSNYMSDSENSGSKSKKSRTSLVPI